MLLCGKVDAGVFNNFQGYKFSKTHKIQLTPILFKPTPIFLEVAFFRVSTENYMRIMLLVLCGVFGFFFARYFSMYHDSREELAGSEKRYKDMVENSADWVWDSIKTLIV